MDTTVNNFEWCGYHWKSEMDGGRLIHSDNPYQWYSLDTIRVCEDNILELWIRNNPKEINHWNGKMYNPSLEVSTMRSLEDFGYGTFSASIIMPKGTNLWSSFWTTGSGNWPPEIDILEAWSGEDGYFKWFIDQPPYLSPSWRTTTNVHFNNKELKHESVGSRNISWFKQTKDPTDNWITYTCDWKPNAITFYTNGKKVRQITGDACKNLIENLKNPKKGYRMNVIFNVWCEDPEKHKVSMRTPMKIKDFKYNPYTIYYRP